MRLRLISTFLYRQWPLHPPVLCTNRAITGRGGRNERGPWKWAPNDERGSWEFSKHCGRSSLLRIGAQNRHNLGPSKQTRALLIKQIFHSSFNPRYWKDLPSLGAALSPGRWLVGVMQMLPPSQLSSCCANTSLLAFLFVFWNHYWIQPKGGSGDAPYLEVPSHGQSQKSMAEEWLWMSKKIYMNFTGHSLFIFFKLSYLF